MQEGFEFWVERLKTQNWRGRLRFGFRCAIDGFFGALIRSAPEPNLLPVSRRLPYL
jgi:hypothetical protein